MIDAVSKKRIFFALWPTEEQRRQIEAAIAPHSSALAGKWTARDNWHVTLVFIGAFPADEIPALHAAAATVCCPEIRLELERIDYWKRPKIMCLATDRVSGELLDLVGALEKAAADFGHKPENRAYKPHMTIARKARYFEPITLAPPLELRFPAFRLIESVSMPDGVKYRPLDQ